MQCITNLFLTILNELFLIIIRYHICNKAKKTKSHNGTILELNYTNNLYVDIKNTLITTTLKY